MKGEVEVTFKCEGCGGVLFVSKHNAANEQELHTNLIQTMRAGDLTCSKCAELRYGPLTEGDVAEAVGGLIEAAYWPPGCYEESTRRVARFVLRLLNSLNAVGSDSYCRLTNTDGSARRELLNLAKEP
jgi:hypothetical protein